MLARPGALIRVVALRANMRRVSVIEEFKSSPIQNPHTLESDMTEQLFVLPPKLKKKR